MTVLFDAAVTQTTIADITAPAPLSDKWLTLTNDSQFRMTYWYDGHTDDMHILDPYQQAEDELAYGYGVAFRAGSTAWQGRLQFSLSLVPGTVLDPTPPASALRIEGFTRQQATRRRTIRSVAEAVNEVPIANAIRGVGQTFPITESDNGTNGPALVPANNGAKMYLSALSNAGARTDLITLDGQAQTTTVNSPLTVTGLLTSGVVASIGGQASAVGANLGVPVVVAKTTHPGFAVTTTGLKLVISFTPTSAGTYRISGHVLINNGTSGQLLTLQLNWTDTNGNTIGRAISALSGGTTQQTVWAGANSIINSAYSIEVQTITTGAGAPISIQFNDPGGTPNDKLMFIIERLD